jgi:Flp pilus assembly protein TadG
MSPVPISPIQALGTLRRDRKGATIVEFAMILPVLCTLLMGFFDLGYRTYVTSIIQGALHEAARMATVGNVPLSAIQAHVQSRLSRFSGNATVTTTTRSYSDFNVVSVPETITQDTAPIGSYNTGDCFEDANGNGTYSLDRGRTGLGGAEDVVYFEVTMTYPHIFPVASLLGWSNNVTITQNTMLRTQPYAGRNTGVAIVC